MVQQIKQHNMKSIFGMIIKTIIATVLFFSCTITIALMIIGAAYLAG